MIATALTCLALNIYFEARNQPYLGQVAVARVTLNRAEAKQVPLCEAVTERGQFSWVKANTFYQKRGRLHVRVPKLEPKSWQKALRVAIGAIRGHVKSDWYYFHHRNVRPDWSQRKIAVAVIGDHIFYSNRR